MGFWPPIPLFKHKTRHQDGGADEINLEDLSGVPIDVDNRVMVRAYLSTDQLNLTKAVWTKIQLNAETYDPGNWFDSSVNYRFTTPVAGYYSVAGSIGWTSTVTDYAYDTAIYVNNAIVTQSRQVIGRAVACVQPAIDVIYLNANDYVELYGRQNSNVNTVDVIGDSEVTYLAIHLLSRG